MTAVLPPKIPCLHVGDIELPREFEKLYELAYNLWWTWSPPARDLFAAIDSAHWQLYGNPVQVLINVEPQRWHVLLEDEGFIARYRQVIGDYERYLHGAEDTWFRQHHGSELQGPVAYFSMEYGLHHSLAVYSGGLGVLSGDHCKSASDLGLPFVAVGLLYRQGYFQQSISAEGLQQHTYPRYDFTRLPLRPVATASGQEVVVQVPLPGRDVAAKVWLAQVGRVPLLLLDTDLDQNHPADRPITNILYVAGREMRLVQELTLGLGGAKVIQALGIEPAVWHLNEGHSVFLQLERLRWRVAAGEQPARALENMRRDTVFTTHTPVPAGNEQFDPPLIHKYLGSLTEQLGLSMDQLLALGRAHDSDRSFNLTALAIRTASFHNGVSRLNARVTSRMWRHLFSDAEPTEQVIQPITNGIHSATWLGLEIRQLLARHLGEDWQDMLLGPEGWEQVMAIPDSEVWEAHLAQKERLGRFTRARLRDHLARHGSSPDELREVDALFDPAALTVGFARRFATYKRANLVFSDLHRLRNLLSDQDRPMQILFAGKAHPADQPGQELIQHIFQLSRSESLAGKVFFLENYDMLLGRRLVQGVDIWLNTPRRPLEASGTSGQKAAANGALNLSIPDGWWPEGYNGTNGWVIGHEEAYDDQDHQDREDAQSLYETLESVALPLYYQRQDDLPRQWIQRMKDSIATLTWKFSASRMVHDYTVEAYLPAARRGSEEG